MSDDVLFYLLFLNILSFFFMGIDKYKAVKHTFRISEKTLLILAFCGGSLGIGAGMIVFHHKVRKKKFFIIIPILLLLQCILIIYTCSIN